MAPGVKDRKTSLILSPTQTEWGSSVVQRAAANQVQLVDLGPSPHQGDDALAVPVGSSIVQRRPAGRNGCRLWRHPMTKLLVVGFRQTGLRYLPRWSFTSTSAAQPNSKLRQSMFLSTDDENVSQCFICKKIKNKLKDINHALLKWCS